MLRRTAFRRTGTLPRLPVLCSLFVVLVSTPYLAAQSVDLNALDDYFAKAQQDWPVPGFSVAIVKDGRIVLEKGAHALRHRFELQSVHVGFPGHARGQG